MFTEIFSQKNTKLLIEPFYQICLQKYLQKIYTRLLIKPSYYQKEKKCKNIY